MFLNLWTGREAIATSVYNPRLRYVCCKLLQVFPPLVTSSLLSLNLPLVFSTCFNPANNRTFWLLICRLECLSALCNNRLQAAEIFPRLPTWQCYFPLERDYATLPLLSNERIRLHIFVSILKFPPPSSPCLLLCCAKPHWLLRLWVSADSPWSGYLLVCWHVQLTNTYVPPRVGAHANTENTLPECFFCFHVHWMDDRSPFFPVLATLWCVPSVWLCGKKRSFWG